jgi:hypothetical protein
MGNRENEDRRYCEGLTEAVTTRIGKEIDLHIKTNIMEEM